MTKQMGLVTEGHALFAYKVLTKQFGPEKADFDHNRDEALFLCLEMLYMCGAEHLIKGLKKQVIQQIKSTIGNQNSDVQDIMTSI